MPKRELLTATEVADKLRVKTRTVREWTRRRAIPAIRVSHKTVRYDLEEVLAALRHETETETERAN